MIIGGWQKNSFIDFPGKISCVLFVSGCNFQCPYCYNPELARGTPAQIMDLDVIYRFLAQRRGWLDGVVISGGEPTLDPDLLALCTTLKQMGYPVKLDTNGSRPQVLERLLAAGAVDYIAMDLKTDPFNYAPLIQKQADPDAILASIQVVMGAGIGHEFRTTCIKPLVDAATVATMAQAIAGANLYALQQFQPRVVLQPGFFSGQDRLYTDAELQQLQSIAAPLVKTCIVR